MVIEPVRREANSHLNERGTPKLTYQTRREAKVGARSFWSSHSTRLWPYRCATCTRWHLSKTKRRTPEEE